MCRKITSHGQPLFSKKMAAAASFSYKIGGGGLIFLQNWRRRPHFPTKLAAVERIWPHYWRQFWHGLDIGWPWPQFRQICTSQTEKFSRYTLILYFSPIQYCHWKNYRKICQTVLDRPKIMEKFSQPPAGWQKWTCSSTCPSLKQFNLKRIS